jgi:heme A synthase
VQRRGRPLIRGVHTAIEFTHRLLSLAVLILGVWLFARVWRDARVASRPVRGHGGRHLLPLRRGRPLGALTVLWGLTGDNTVVARA